MPDFDAKVKHLRTLLLSCVRDVEAESNAFAGRHAASLETARQLAEQLSGEFDLHKTASQKPALTVRQNQLKVNKLTSKVKRLQLEVAQLKGRKMSGKIQHVWYLRVVFSPSSLSMQALSSWCRDFGVQEDPVMSKTTIAKAKDCFAQILKMLSAQALTQAGVAQGTVCNTSESKPFFFAIFMTKQP